MIEFMYGLTVGGALGLWSLHSYKSCLKQIAETTQSEYILGEWYRIQKEK